MSCCGYKNTHTEMDGTYDHRLRRIGHPVRSAIHKPQIGRLVVGWVTTSESLLLYVFCFCFCTFGNGWVGCLLIVYVTFERGADVLTYIPKHIASREYISWILDIPSKLSSGVQYHVVA